jgi:UDP-N-acetylmuramoyl-tripeptide--D-alanyl-D-alanine ligase
MHQPPIYKGLFHTGRRKLAGWWLSRFPQIRIIGITGSYGKTNTVRAITSVLKQKYSALSTNQDLDTIYNLPITLLHLRSYHQYLILEYGIDHLGEMDRHIQLVKPDIAVLTGLTPVHTDAEHLGSFANLIKEKAKLLASVPKQGVVIANFDDLLVRKIIRQFQSTGTCPQIVTYGLKSGADYQARIIRLTTKGTEMDIRNSKFKIQNLKIGLVGKHFAHQALVASIIGHLNQISDRQIKSGLAALTPLPGRMSVENGPQGTMILNDSKRSNPASAIAGLETFAQLVVETGGHSSLRLGRKIAVLGEMGEINEKLRINEHWQVGKRLGQLNKQVDYFVAIGPLMKTAAEAAVKAGMKNEKVTVVTNVHQATKVLKILIKPGDWIYLKGSLLRHLERILLLLEGNTVVGCDVVSCPFYRHCSNCQYLESGYQGQEE